MIDYTYWQANARLRLHDGEILYRPVRFDNVANFLIGVQAMNEQREEKWQKILADFSAIEDRSVKWLFQEQGEIILSGKVNGLSEDELTLIGLSCGVEEIYFDENNLGHFLCAPNKLAQIADILSLEDVEIVHELVGYRPAGLVEIYDKAQAKRVYDFCEKLGEMEFIVDICADFGIGEYWLEEFRGFLAK